MIKRYFFLRTIFSCLIAYSSSTYATPITWVAQGSNNDMNDPANWNPSIVPGSTDEAIFNRNLLGVNTNPAENFTPFSVSTFNFPSGASVFHFDFNNETLTFNGAGITGSNTNPTITVSNINNTFFPGDLLSFIGGTGTSASSIITSSNSGTLTGNLSGTSIGSFNSNFHSTGPFTIEKNGSITASNIGIDSTIGTGNNGSANTGNSQLKFDQSFTAGNNVSLSISNSGSFSGTNTVQGDAVSIINGSQFIASDGFQVGNNFKCDVQNTGVDSCQGVGLSNIGQINAAQMILQGAGTAGNNCMITVSNTGINNSETTNFPDFIGYLNDEQFFVRNAFQAGDNFSLTATNTGTDTSNGYGGYQVAVINSNSGTTGNQILFQEGCMLGDHATIHATNNGNYSGSNAHGGSNVAGMNLGQIAIGDRTLPGSYNFIAGDYFTLKASNSGTDSSQGTGGNATGDVSGDQIAFFTPLTLGNHANITIDNSGNFSGDASSTYVNVGSTGGSQFNCLSTCTAQDDFTLNVSNSGINNGSGIGNYFIGDLITGQQVTFQNDLELGNKASITISNSGSNSSSTTSNNQVGSFMGYGKQLFAKYQFQAGDDLYLEITNQGFDDSTGSGGNFVGFMNNNTVDDSASQFHLGDGGSIGNRASITISNTGTYQGSNTISGNLIATLAGQQFYSVSDFNAGDDFTLYVSNEAFDHASGQNNNSIGTIGSSQIEFGGAFTAQNNASFLITNSGTNNDPTGTFNNIGVVNGSQLLVNGNFTAGEDFNLSALNTSINEGNINNFVAHVTGSQVVFSESCTFNDGTLINAFNSGTVDNSQIVFGQGFNLTSGKMTIQAINEGTLGSFGIDIQGSNAGGNAKIILGDSTLNIGTTLSTFTVAGLTGDNTSIVQSRPKLVINTETSTNYEFQGIIQDYPSTNSTLMKTGKGTQKLSGISTYTGLTTIQEGILVVNGSLAGDVLVNTFGTLKGNGSISGTLTNKGTVSPGESIGTITVGNFVNNGGIYAVEVNGLGQSDLIAASGTATLNGGTVVVSSSDGTFTFNQPYTFLTAQGGIQGVFSSVTSRAFITSTLTYDQNNSYLTLEPALIKAAEKCNQLSVATNLDNISSLNAGQSLLIGAIANLPLVEAQDALESLSGFQYTNDVIATNISTSRFLKRLYDPLRPIVNRSNQSLDCSAPCDEWTTWLETGYGLTNLNGTTSHKLNINSYQITSGIQKTFCNDLTLGLAGSYENDNVCYRDGKGNRNSVFASAYGLYRPRVFYALFDLVYGYSSNHLKRTIKAGNLEYKAHSKQDSNLFTFYGEAGFDLSSDCVLIQPFLGIQIGKNWRGSINESQKEGWGLKINQKDFSTTSSRLGLHLSTSSFSDLIDASFDMAWNQLWSSRKNSAIGRFKEFGNAFAICGNKLDNYSFDYALTLTTYFCDGLKGYFEIEGESWEHANTLNVLGGIEFSW